MSSLAIPCSVGGWVESKDASPPPASDVALKEMTTCRHWWREDVYDAFLRAVGGGADAVMSAAA